MKKLELKAIELGAAEILTRAQLKKLVGGSYSNPEDCPDNECGGTLGACPEGQSCGSVSCDDDQYSYTKCS